MNPHVSVPVLLWQLSVFHSSGFSDIFNISKTKLKNILFSKEAW